MKILQKLVDQSRQVLACRDAADRPRKDVVKHERGNAEFSECPAEGHFHGAIYAAAHKHAATFHVNRADCIGKHHDSQDEPRRGLANVAFRFAASVVG